MMIMSPRLFALYPAFLLFLFSPGFAAAQVADQSADATARVPALEQFHEVIFEIWHDAWPNKNTGLLKKLLSDVEKGIAEVAGAPLPGILREKKTAWAEGVRKLQSVGSEYKNAAGSGDDARLLVAAEKLHSQYETLVRLIRPAIKEIDEFHSVLYRLYHYDLPEYNLEKIRSASAELTEKMKALNAAKLPARHSAKQQDFDRARSDLARTVDALAASLGTNDEKAIRQAVNSLHTSYETLNGIFQ
jgi:NADH dehydrogenase/NADH:ubiquinone oxidoreductase subunit G